MNNNASTLLRNYQNSLNCIYLQLFRGLSFPTISSVGSNAAIIHYSPQADTCAELGADKIYLFDSGAQVCHSSSNSFIGPIFSCN